MTKHIGIFGGTFNPVHNGHIASARFVQQHCALDEVRLMPCQLPPHRATPGVSAEQRAAMVQLAIAGYPKLALERLELDKQSPSYTVDSLQLLHQREPDSRFYFIIGMDSLCYFRQWKNWQRVLQLAHLLVCERPGYQATDGDAPFLLQQYGVDDMAALQQSTVGGILLLDNPLFDISATQIRTAFTANQQNTPAPSLQIPQVLAYIQQHQLYQV